MKHCVAEVFSEVEPVENYSKGSSLTWPTYRSVSDKQTGNRRGRKKHKKCFKSHITGRVALRNASSNCQCEAFILQLRKWIFKLIPLNKRKKINIYVYIVCIHISAVTYAGQETFRPHWILMKEAEIHCFYPFSSLWLALSWVRFQFSFVQYFRFLCQLHFQFLLAMD